MRQKNVTFHSVKHEPNSLITIVGRDMGTISAFKVESIIDCSLPEAEKILTKAINENKFQPLITEKNRMKSLVIMDNGKVYPSTFRVQTLTDRIFTATNISNSEAKESTLE